MKALTTRAKFAWWTTGLTAAALLAFAAGTLYTVLHEQNEEADSRIKRAWRQLQLLEDRGERRERLDALARVADEQGIAYAHAPGAGPVVVPAEGPFGEHFAQAALGAARARTLRRGAAAWRVRAYSWGSDTIVIAADLTQVYDTLSELLSAYALTLPLVALAAGVGAWWLAGRALAPVRALTGAAATITSENLQRRVPTREIDDEIGRLAGVLNAMLERLERSFRQAERFAADASHELRTPLTIMQGEIEALLHSAGLARESETRLLSIHEEIGRLTRTCNNLLLLARFDAGQAKLATQPVDFSALVTEACEDAQLLAVVRRVVLEARCDPGLVVRGDAGLLRQLLLNLLDNAAKFNVPNGKLCCTLTARENQVECLVANTGPGIPAAMRDRVFERFFRVDTARTEAGHGLGLALCSEITRAHGGTLQLLDSSPNEMTEFRVRLPRSITEEGASRTETNLRAKELRDQAS